MGPRQAEPRSSADPVAGTDYSRAGGDPTSPGQSTPATDAALSSGGPSPSGRPARYDRRQRHTPTLSVIVPTYNEADNVPILIEQLRTELKDFDYEVIIVDDDSPDLTWRIASEIVADDNRFTVVRRTSDRGLSAAVLTGMSVASGSVLVVMDGDLQHDPGAIPHLASKVIDDGVDITVASRAVDGGSYGDFSPRRRFISWVGAQMAHALLRTPVTDPMSGFFALSRRRYEQVVDLVNPRGFKILLEFLARGSRPNVAEVGYRFGNRLHGATKLTGSVVVAYLLALIELSVGRFVSASFTAYSLVGLLGLGVRSSAQWLLAVPGFAPVVSGGVGVLIAVQLSIVGNYLLNNTLTFTARRHRGRQHVRGFMWFQIVSIYGLVVHAGAVALLSRDAAGEGPFGLTGLWSVDASLPFVAGLFMALIGNYYLNSTITWRPNP